MDHRDAVGAAEDIVCPVLQQRHAVALPAAGRRRLAARAPPAEEQRRAREYVERPAGAAPPGRGPRDRVTLLEFWAYYIFSSTFSITVLYQWRPHLLGAPFARGAAASASPAALRWS